MSGLYGVDWCDKWCLLLYLSLCTLYFQTTPGVLQGFAIFALCIARYSATVHLTPEIATFDPIRKTAIRFYRTFYVLLVGLVHAAGVWMYVY